MESSSQKSNKQLFISLGTHPSKSSLLTRFCNENKYAYVNCQNKDNILEHVLHQHSEINDKNIVLNHIPLTLNNFYEVEKAFEDHRVLVLYFKGTQIIANQYQKLALLKIIDLKISKNIDESFKILKKALINKVIFVYGAPRSRKTQFAHKIQESLGYKYLYFNNLKKQFYPDSNQVDQVTTVNKLIKYLSTSSENIVIDGFFQTKKALPILVQYLQPFRIFHLQTSNDQIQTFIHEIKDKNLKEQKKQQFQNYLDNKDDIVVFLKSKPYFTNIQIDADLQKVSLQLKPIILYIQLSDQNFIDEVAKQWQGTHINLANLETAHELRQRKGILKDSNIQQKVEYLKNIISFSNGKIILSGFSDKLEDFIVFERHIAQIKYYYLFNEFDISYSQIVTPSMYYLGEEKLIRLDSKHLSTTLVLSYLDTRNSYLLISGPQTSGKTQIAKIIARDYGYTHIQFAEYLDTYKQKNPPQDGDQFPISVIRAHFKQLFSNKNLKYIIQGLPYEGNDFINWIKQVGYPTSINLRLDNDSWLKRYRKKQQIDPETQVTQQDQQKINTVQQQNATYLKNLEQTYDKFPNIKLFQFDCNAALISLQNFLPLILRPRVYIVAENSSASNILFLNIALKYNMTIFDLSNTDVRNIVPLLSNTSIQRDIILYNYSSKDRLISDDLYFIQKNIGSVRFVSVWGTQEKQFKDEKMKLERPVVEVKKKKQVQQGQQQNQEGAPVQQQQPAAEEQQPQLDEDGNPIKPKMDIYNFQWSETGTSKNLSQWFMNFKKPIKQFVFEQANKIQMYNDFELVISELNRDRTSHIYTIIN